MPGLGQEATNLSITTRRSFGSRSVGHAVAGRAVEAEKLGTNSGVFLLEWEESEKVGSAGRNLRSMHSFRDHVCIVRPKLTWFPAGLVEEVDFHADSCINMWPSLRWGKEEELGCCVDVNREGGGEMQDTFPLLHSDVKYRMEPSLSSACKGT